MQAIEDFFKATWYASPLALILGGTKVISNPLLTSQPANTSTAPTSSAKSSSGTAWLILAALAAFVLLT